ncbi:FAD-linked oxidoreductase [Lachnellula occidentalis]|uniref:FAD-linked oxidoreductase n=1 Tax=Lachnellula occidentalis TaxID=215460 RepID=A0A8H8RT18_9HELO|nr:FAD-linked oxidoreductase [Lachnellula occidentalis]
MISHGQLFGGLLFALSLVTRSKAATPTAAQWAALNQTVNGRLHAGVPLAQSCYSSYNGTATTPDAAVCSAVQTNYTANNYISGHYGGFMNTNWGTCQRTGEGCPLDWNSPSDPTVYAPGQTCYQGSVSPFYIEVQEVSDIQAGLQFANDTGVPLSIKNTGHDYTGRSSAPGSLALWTHNVQPEMTYTKGFVPDGCSEPVGDGVTMGAGQQFAGLYQFADENNVTVVGGASGSVGPAGGWVTGGGHSAITNVFGLGVDNVMQIRTVLPNGTYVTANECQNQDLWFALRGGGGSTFGVNFEMTTRANPKIVLQVAYINYYSPDTNSSAELISLMIQSATKWAAEGWGGYLSPGAYSKQYHSLILMTPLLTNAEAVASMTPLFELAYANGNYVYSMGINTVNSYYEMYNVYLAPGGEKLGLGTALGSRLIPASQFATPAKQDALLDALLEVQDMITYPTRSTDSLLLSYGVPFQILVTAPSNYPTTAANDTSSVHPAWREAVWHMVMNVPFSNSASAGDIKTAFQIATDTTDVLRKLVPDSGAYLNEADTFEKDPVGTFWGQEKYERLVGIKKVLDPGNLLTCFGCIGWDETDERYGCYPDM